MRDTTIPNRSTQPFYLRARLVGTLSAIACLGLTVASLSGCGFRDIDFDPPEEGLFDGLAQPDLANVPQRLALGTTAPAQVLNADQATVSSSDSTIVAVERLNERDVVLMAIGAGSTTISLSGEGVPIKDYPITVAEVDRSEVLLVESAPFPPNPVEVVPVHEQVLLSGVEQQLVVAHYDSEAELLYGEGLATFDILEGAEPCEVDVVGPFDAACVVLRAGTNVLRVEVASEERNIVIGGVSQDQIVDLIVLETEGMPTEGDTIGMIAIGLTEEDAWVYGMHAQYETEAYPVLATFAYDHDPDADPKTVTVRAFGFERAAQYHGAFNFTSHPKLLWSICGGWLAGLC